MPAGARPDMCTNKGPRDAIATMVDPSASV